MLEESVFAKLDGFNYSQTEQQKLFRKMASLDFESICIPTEEFRATNTTTWVGKHVLCDSEI